MPTVLNAADEIAIEAFLKRKIKFTDIPKVINVVMDRHNSIDAVSLEAILTADQWARNEAKRWIERHLEV